MVVAEGWIDWNSSCRRRHHRRLHLGLDSGYGFRTENRYSAYHRRHHPGLYQSKVNVFLTIVVSKGHRALRGFRFESLQPSPYPYRSIRRTEDRWSMHRLALRVR